MMNPVKEAIRKMKEVTFIYANSPQEEKEEIMKLFSEIELRYESEKSFFIDADGFCSCPQENGTILYKDKEYCLDCFKSLETKKEKGKDEKKEPKDNPQGTCRIPGSQT